MCIGLLLLSFMSVSIHAMQNQIGQTVPRLDTQCINTILTHGSVGRKLIDTEVLHDNKLNIVIQAAFRELAVAKNSIIKDTLKAAIKKKQFYVPGAGDANEVVYLKNDNGILINGYEWRWVRSGRRRSLGDVYGSDYEHEWITVPECWLVSPSGQILWKENGHCEISGDQERLPAREKKQLSEKLALKFDDSEVIKIDAHTLLETDRKRVVVYDLSDWAKLKDLCKKRIPLAQILLLAAIDEARNKGVYLSLNENEQNIYHGLLPAFKKVCDPHICCYTGPQDMMSLKSLKNWADFWGAVCGVWQKREANYQEKLKQRSSESFVQLMHYQQKKEAKQNAKLIGSVQANNATQPEEAPLADIQENAEQFLVYASVGNTEGVELLIDQGIDLEAKDASGNTALMLAARNGYSEMVDLLLSCGADSDAVNRFDQNAIDLARETGQYEIVSILAGDVGNESDEEDRDYPVDFRP